MFSSAFSFAAVRPPTTTYVPRADLPPHLQSLFNPRPPLPFMKVPLKPKCRPYAGLSEYVDLFEEAPPLDRDKSESTLDKRHKALKAKQQQHLETQEKQLASWKPAEYTFDSDPLKTLFVYRLPFDCDERKLKREFEVFGPIRSLHVVKDKTGKPRGYAFIEYENEKDYKSENYTAAYKHGDGLKISNRRVLVDSEKGRISKDWKPRFLGGGRGNSRAARQKGERNGGDGQNLYDESRGYKVHSEARSRSRSPKRGGARPDERWEKRFAPPQQRRDDYQRDSDQRRERFRREEMSERRPPRG